MPARKSTRTGQGQGRDVLNRRQGKRPFEVEVAVRRIRKAVEALPKAALFELAAEGFDSPFEQLVACMISIRTRDEVTLPVARRLFKVARSAAQMVGLRPAQIDSHIGECTFHEAKAQQIHEIARRVVADHGGRLPCDRETLLSFRGVGPKCANLVLGITCGQPCVGVDVHVHRVVNRWGYVETRSPEKTMQELTARLPRQYWVEINGLLVPFGKRICTGRAPKCSTCPVLDTCQQVGVTIHR